jgi:hypothetical protein
MIRVGGSSGAPIVKWGEVKPGDAIEGTFVGIEDGMYGDLAVVHGAAGAVRLPVPAALTSKIKAVKTGAWLQVVYLGKKKNPKTAREYHDFDLFVKSQDDLLKNGDR